MQFEAQLNLMGIADENGKSKNLLCCADAVAFGTVTNAIILNQNVTYTELKTLPNEKFCGTEYKQNLESKLRSLTYRKGINCNVFNHNFKACIKGLHGTTDSQTINAKNHVVKNLGEYLRRYAKHFHLSFSQTSSGVFGDKNPDS